MPRGTPLISPHIKWDHSQTWDVPTAKDFPSGSSGSSASTVCNISESGLRWGEGGGGGAPSWAPALRPSPCRHQP